ncbi:predicted protein [Postia placenta Mad-698-R]|nr:predicted protein [Postia placenta Mad-698-R]
MTTFAPLPGTYLTIRLNPVTMVEHLEDSVALDAARQMSVGTYIAYVEHVYDFPWPDRPTHKCRINFVGQGLPKRLKDEFMEPSMRATLKRDAGVSGVDPDTIRLWDRPDGQPRRKNSLDEIIEQMPDSDNDGTSDGGSEGRNLDTHSEPSMIGSDDESGSQESAVDITGIVLGDKCDEDPDLVPLVEVSLEISKVERVLDPIGFLEEQEAIIVTEDGLDRIIKESRARNPALFAQSLANSEQQFGGGAWTSEAGAGHSKEFSASTGVLALRSEESRVISPGIKSTNQDSSPRSFELPPKWHTCATGVPRPWWLCMHLPTEGSAGNPTLPSLASVCTKREGFYLAGSRGAEALTQTPLLSMILIAALIALQPRWPFKLAASATYAYSIALLSVCTAGIISIDYCLGCLFVGQFLIAFQLLWLHDPLTEFKHERDTVPPAELPFWRRTYWVLCIFIGPRGIGWAHQASIPYVPPRPYVSRDVFTRRQLLKALRWYLFIDIARAYQLAHELFTRPVTDLFDVASRGYLQRCANVAALLGPWLGTLAMDYYLFSAAHVNLGWSAPGDWPDVYGNWADAYTVRRFWGRTYHQYFRRHTAFVGKGCCRLLRLQPGSWASSYTQLYVGFATSGFMHCVGDFIVDRALFGMSFPFFLAQAVAISLEDAAIGVARRTGLQSLFPAYLWRMLGYAWVVVWFSVSAPWFIVTSIRVGVLFPSSARGRVAIEVFGRTRDTIRRRRHTKVGRNNWRAKLRVTSCDQCVLSRYDQCSGLLPAELISNADHASRSVPSLAADAIHTMYSDVLCPAIRRRTSFVLRGARARDEHRAKLLVARKAKSCLMITDLRPLDTCHRAKTTIVGNVSTKADKGPGLAGRLCNCQAFLIHEKWNRGNEERDLLSPPGRHPALSSHVAFVLLLAADSDTQHSLPVSTSQQPTIARPPVGCTFGAIPLPLVILVIVTVEQPYADTHKWISNAAFKFSLPVTTMPPISTGTVHAQSYEEAENGATHAMDYSSRIWDELLDWRPHDDIHAPHLRRAPEPVPQGFSVEPTSTVISFPGQSTQSGSSTFVSSPASASASASSTPSTISASSTIPTIPATPPVLPTPFPQPFSSLGSSNFATESCYIFFQNMSDTDPFRTCRPFSLLVQSSADFINSMSVASWFLSAGSTTDHPFFARAGLTPTKQAQSNITLLNTLVWGTCNTDPSVDQCVANMGWFAQQLQSACTTEISQTNELVTSTLIGLEAYSLMRSAGCLPDTATNAYCYVESVESSHPDDMFYYQLPLGTALPNNTLPSCSSCTQSLMAQYVEEGLNTTGLRETYADAALITNKVCGNGFVSETVTEKTGGALRARTGTWAAVAAVVLAIAHVSC